jgi:flagellar biosynthetic protein FliQ
MTDSTVLEIAQRALMVAIYISAPVLGVGLVVGLVVSVFQAATQIHEMSLTFIPKMLAIGLVFVICGPWMLAQILKFTTDMIQSIPSMVR